MERPPPPRLAKRIKRTARYYVLRVLAGLVSLLPPRAAGALGEFFGGLAGRLIARERAKAFESLGIAFPELPRAEHERIVNAMFRHLGRMLLELVCSPKIDRELDAWVEFPPETRAVIANALAPGKGALFVTGHIGSWELLAHGLSALGHGRLAAIGKESSDPRLSKLVEDLRARGNVDTVWRGRPSAARAMLKTLKEGRMLGILIDQDTDVQSVFVPFFGRPAKTPRAAADLAMRTGAQIILGTCTRQANGRYRVFAEQVPLPATDTEADSVALTADLTARLEREIRKTPEQWVWLHRRWKTPPPA